MGPRGIWQFVWPARSPTSKRFEYILNLRHQSAIAAKRSWRKQINLIHSLLITQKDIATLTAGCEELEKKMTLFCESHEALEAIIDDEEERKLMYEDFEVISRENNAVLRMISKKIKSQEQELDLKSLTTSGSTKTSKIFSRLSRKSSHTPPPNSSLSVREEGPTWRRHGFSKSNNGSCWRKAKERTWI